MWRTEIDDHGYGLRSYRRSVNQQRDLPHILLRFLISFIKGFCFVIGFSSLLALSVALKAADLWLAFVFLALVLLATLSCRYKADQTPTTVIYHTAVVQEHADPTVKPDTNCRYWLELPPEYDEVARVHAPSTSGRNDQLESA
ncbi:hypothetical protein J6590_045584 [Homalodisca vitripennis]|nr:hypothetical protein J6590_045584 [Homalodisca vitripennis]